MIIDLETEQKSLNRLRKLSEDDSDSSPVNSNGVSIHLSLSQ